MEISEVRVKLVERENNMLKAFCSVTFDNAFVVRDVKVIEGKNGPFISMPSRKITDRCRCGYKNSVVSKFCNECGAKLGDNRANRDPQGRLRLYVDIAHPINTQARQQIEVKILEAYKKELAASSQPDYKPAEMETPEEDAHGGETAEQSK